MKYAVTVNGVLMLQESRADECVQTTHKLVSTCFKVVGILIPHHVLKCILMFLTNKTSRAQVLVGEKPHSRLKPTSMQVDTDLLRLVNRQAGRLKRCSLLMFVL